MANTIAPLPIQLVLQSQNLSLSGVSTKPMLNRLLCADRTGIFIRVLILEVDFVICIIILRVLLKAKPMSLLLLCTLWFFLHWFVSILLFFTFIFHTSWLFGHCYFQCLHNIKMANVPRVDVVNVSDFDY